MICLCLSDAGSTLMGGVTPRYPALDVGSVSLWKIRQSVDDALKRERSKPTHCWTYLRRKRRAVPVLPRLWDRCRAVNRPAQWQADRDGARLDSIPHADLSQRPLSVVSSAKTLSVTLAAPRLACLLARALQLQIVWMVRRQASAKVALLLPHQRRPGAMLRQISTL